MLIPRALELPLSSDISVKVVGNSLPGNGKRKKAGNPVAENMETGSPKENPLENAP
jgi:hypothetical protein